MKEYDAVIIGFGKGGKTLAVDLDKRGLSVALIERSDKMYGGVCINTGCIPTKALIHQARKTASCGEKTFEEKAEAYRRAIRHKNEITALLRDKNYHNLADREHITVYTGEGYFTSPDTVAVRTDGETTELKGKHIFINTGSDTVVPPIEGLPESRNVYTSASIMELEELPERLVVIGGGYIGLEFSSLYTSFGSRVTVLEGNSELIPKEDRDMAASVQEVLERKGISFKFNASVQAVRDTADGTAVKVRDARTEQEYEITADAVLVAVGRRPYTEGLNLEAAGVQLDSRGAIVVDEHLRTTAPRIYALGDVTGGPQFTYVSLDDYRIVRDDLFGKGERNRVDRLPVPYSVFIEPPFSRIGMSEEEARRAGLDFHVKKIAVAAIPRARTVDQTDGMLKAVIENGSGRILGCTLFCTDSHEVINTVTLAMKAGLDARFLHDFIYTHPSMSESLNDLFA